MDDVTVRVLALLRWDWIDVEGLITQVAATIPPGRALRHYQKTLGKHRTGTKPELSEAQQIASGARGIINARLLSLRDNGVAEMETRDGGRSDRWIRRRERRRASQPAGGSPFGWLWSRTVRV